MSILVATASRHGSTAEVATALAAAMRHHGEHVDVMPVELVRGVDEYHAVVLGSAVYRNRWLREARDFADVHQEELRRRAVFLFSSGPVSGTRRSAGPPCDVSVAAGRTGAREHRMFAGKLDPLMLGTGERVIARLCSMRVGDFRDWDAIGSWAAEIVDSLRPVAVGARGSVVTADPDRRWRQSHRR